MAKVNPTKGTLLIAEPSTLNDYSFNRSVIYLTEHGDEGSVGFIINKPTTFVLSDLIPDISCDFTIFSGGPVEQENLYFIHTIPDVIPNSIEIKDGIYWGGDFDTLTALLKNKSVKKEEIRFFLGYSGWSENQLIEELTDNTWVVINNKHKNILDLKSEDIWKNEMMEFGGEYQLWANAPKNPTLN
ncbi:MAG TPA: YqgE/AlgH family protein [Flavobacteriaceae bacterium]|nr:YqgE/AlgH family protein [Flavobacteriaceae bacterium]